MQNRSSLAANCFVVFFLVVASVSYCMAETRDYPIKPVPAHRVRLNDVFWAPRLEINRTSTVPACFQMCEETGRVENFKVAAQSSDAKWTGMFGFNDSDIYKVIEGASYSLMTHPDEKLAAYVNRLVGLIAAAQEKDGYLYTWWTSRDRIAEPNPVKCCIPGGKKWMSEKDSHELYNLGHMYEAAVAHWEATGDQAFLNVAKKSADLLVDTFGPGKLEMPSGHPEVELGLVRLYRATGDDHYLKLAKSFLDVRGRPTKDRPQLWGEYTQDQEPFVKQQKAVGHAVRAMYLYAGATDVAALTGDSTLRSAVGRLWDNTVGQKTYITGAIGATAAGEAFGKDYELPNDKAYAESCANLATCFWNDRMFLLSGNARYIDVLERALYNSAISGVSVDGKSFFYPNPLASTGNYARSKWFDCACCPTNLCRFIASVPGYMYATRDDTLYVNLYAAGTADIELPSGKVHIEQETNYPWDGQLKIKFTPQSPGQRFELRVRIPCWWENTVLPGKLYSYTDTRPQERFNVSLNGKPNNDVHGDSGYAVLETRAWQPGDTVTIEMPMPVRRVVADEKVEADRGLVALMRGPIVYCIESRDLPPRFHPNELMLPDTSELRSEFRKDLLGGVQVVTGVMRRVKMGTEERQDPTTGKATQKQFPITEELEFKAIPYCVWANRGPSEMTVWVKRGTGLPPRAKK